MGMFICLSPSDNHPKTTKDDHTAFGVCMQGWKCVFIVIQTYEQHWARKCHLDCGHPSAINFVKRGRRPPPRVYSGLNLLIPFTAFRRKSIALGVRWAPCRCIVGFLPCKNIAITILNNLSTWLSTDAEPHFADRIPAQKLLEQSQGSQNLTIYQSSMQ